MIHEVYSQPAGCDYAFVVRGHTERRLAHTCFRGRDLRAAGNFCRWENAEELFEDDLFVDRLLVACHDRLHRTNLRTEPVTLDVQVEYPEFVGWSSTIDLETVDERVLEPYEPNKHTTAKRVRPTSTNVLAPRTRLVTLDCEFRRIRRGGIEAIAHTIYPGRYVGALRRDPGDRRFGRVDVTAREGVAFLDWDHPGQRLANP